MIAIYSKKSQKHARDLAAIANHALQALRAALERIEANGGCTAPERAKLEKLQKMVATLLSEARGRDNNPLSLSQCACPEMH